MKLPFLAIDLILQEPVEHTAGELLRRRFSIPRIGVELLEIFFPAIDHHLLMSRRFVAQFSIVTRDSELLDQSDRRKQFRFAEHHFSKNLFVEKIETPRTKPDQIDEENRHQNHNQRENPEQQFEDPFEHMQSFLMS